MQLIAYFVYMYCTTHWLRNWAARRMSKAAWNAGYQVGRNDLIKGRARLWSYTEYAGQRLLLHEQLPRYEFFERAAWEEGYGYACTLARLGFSPTYLKDPTEHPDIESYVQLVLDGELQFDLRWTRPSPKQLELWQCYRDYAAKVQQIWAKHRSESLAQNYSEILYHECIDADKA